MHKPDRPSFPTGVVYLQVSDATMALSYFFFMLLNLPTDFVSKGAPSGLRPGFDFRLSSGRRKTLNCLLTTSSSPSSSVRSTDGLLIFKLFDFFGPQAEITSRRELHKYPHSATSGIGEVCMCRWEQPMSFAFAESTS